MKTLPLIICICILSACFPFSEGYINNLHKSHSYWKCKQKLSNCGASHQKQPDHGNSHSPQDPQPSTYPDKNNIGVNGNHSQNATTVSAKDNGTTGSSVITTNGVIHLSQNATTVSARDNGTTGSSVITTNGVIHLAQNAITVSARDNGTTGSSVAAATAQSPAPGSPETTGALPISLQDISGPKPCSDSQEIIALPEATSVPTTMPQPEILAALDTISDDSPVPVVPEISTSTAASINQISSLATNQATTSEQIFTSLEQAEILRKVLEFLNSING